MGRAEHERLDNPVDVGGSNVRKKKCLADIVFPGAIKFRVDKDVGYVGRLLNGIINISLSCASLAAFLYASPSSDSREIPLPIIYAKS